ncbi:hypothetical protein [Lactobacillus rhamnosus DSM 14870] [Lacticaseibacillus rhamnosus]|nr:hypothetical protein [Lactobacillus rhamnosus DSM 14870] [Lacticaseibacillus rhamnosus]
MASHGVGKYVNWCGVFIFFFFQAEDGIRDQPRSRGLGDVYKRQWLYFFNQYGMTEIQQTDFQGLLNVVLNHMDSQTSLPLTPEILQEDVAVYLSLIHI